MSSINSSPEKASVNYRLLRIAAEKFEKMPAALTPEEYKEVSGIAAREFLIEQAVLSSDEAKGVMVPDAELNNAINQIANRYPTEDEFFEEMEAQGLGVEELKLALERELRVDAVLAKVGSGAERVDDTEVNLFYYMNRDRFEHPEMRTARHILITINPEFPENTFDAAFKRMEQIRNRIDKKPHRFEEQASKHSECPTSLNGGLLGNVKSDQLYPELGAALFQMKEGEVSDIIESEVGLHILLCEQIIPEGTAVLENVHAKLREQLQERKQAQFTRNWIQELVKAQNEQLPDRARETA